VIVRNASHYCNSVPQRVIHILGIVQDPLCDLFKDCELDLPNSHFANIFLASAVAKFIPEL